MNGEIDSTDEISALEQDQTFLALIVLRDPIRDSIIKMVQEAEETGIKLHLISGDNLATACKAAHDVGIIDSEDYECTKNVDSDRKVAMEASEFRELVGEV